MTATRRRGCGDRLNSLHCTARLLMIMLVTIRFFCGNGGSTTSISLNASAAAAPMWRPHPLLPGLVAPSARAPSQPPHHCKGTNYLYPRMSSRCSTWSTHLEFFHESLKTWASGRSIYLRLVRFFLLKIQCPECSELVIWLVQLRLTRSEAWPQAAQAGNMLR